MIVLDFTGAVRPLRSRKIDLQMSEQHVLCDLSGEVIVDELGVDP
jgi:hypothetical protein